MCLHVSCLETSMSIKLEPINHDDQIRHQPMAEAIKCEFCSQRFNLKKFLIEHISAVHNKNNKADGGIKLEASQTS